MTAVPEPTDYDTIAERYSEKIDQRPWNVLYERPATLALLPEVDKTDVLDAGCGPGWYAEWLVHHGARVVAVDRSASGQLDANIPTRASRGVAMSDRSGSSWPDTSPYPPRDARCAAAKTLYRSWRSLRYPPSIYAPPQFSWELRRPLRQQASPGAS